jgi:hypothetical protein
MTDRTPAAKRPAAVVSTDTLYIDRVVDTLALLCGGIRPPRELVVAWEENTSEELQSWAMCNAASPWATGIGTIEAAQTMANTPEEGMGHQDREDAYPVDPASIRRDTSAADLSERITAACGNDWTLDLTSAGQGSLVAGDRTYFQFVGELDDVLYQKLIG